MFHLFSLICVAGMNDSSNMYVCRTDYNQNQVLLNIAVSNINTSENT